MGLRAQRRSPGGLTELERDFEVTIVTQNIDNLHERGGSSHVVHLHGELTKARSTLDPDYVCEIEGWELKLGDRCPRGSQLRPHIVWFGEDVPMMGAAIEIVRAADVVVIVGTSLAVYPAASLVDFAPAEARLFLIDPQPPRLIDARLTVIPAGASEGVARLRALLSGAA